VAHDDNIGGRLRRGRTLIGSFPGATTTRCSGRPLPGCCFRNGYLDPVFPRAPRISSITETSWPDPDSRRFPADFLRADAHARELATDLLRNGINLDAAGIDYLAELLNRIELWLSGAKRSTRSCRQIERSVMKLNQLSHGTDQNELSCLIPINRRCCFLSPRIRQPPGSSLSHWPP
jgi:hypothetical protein